MVFQSTTVFCCGCLLDDDYLIQLGLAAVHLAVIETFILVFIKLIGLLICIRHGYVFVLVIKI